VQPVSAAHAFDTVIFLICLHVGLPALTALRFRNFSCLCIMNSCITSFFVFSDLVVLTYWSCLRYQFLCPLTLFPLCFFSFSAVLLASSVINKRVTIFSISYFLDIFGIGLTFKSLAKVILSEAGQKKI